jgi:hypothetical protein
MGKNNKSKGENGENIAIGELAKLGINVCVPLSDNLPFDFIIIYEDKLLKAQIKSSAYTNKKSKGSLEFTLVTNNWHKKTRKVYNSTEIDTIILCDFKYIYLLKKEEWENKCSFALRYENSLNNHDKNCHFAKDYILSIDRMKEVWGSNPLGPI